MTRSTPSHQGPRDAEKHLRAEVGRRSRELKRMLLDWDVLEVYHGAGSPHDDSEYDDLIWPIMSWLIEGANEEELGARLAELLRSEYGLDRTDASGEAGFSRRLQRWWRANS